MYTFRIYRGGTYVKDVECLDDNALKRFARWINKRRAGDPGGLWEIVCVSRTDGKRPRIRWGHDIQYCGTSRDALSSSERWKDPKNIFHGKIAAFHGAR